MKPFVTSIENWITCLTLTVSVMRAVDDINSYLMD